METVEERNVFIDNVKGILIFLVVLGHTIELYMYENLGLFMAWIYIYCFHMPLFVYISGFLSGNMEKAQGKAFQRFLLPYLVWNSFAFILTSVYYRRLEFSILRPWSVNWYFLSLFTMCLFLPVIVKIRRSVYGIFSISLLAGILPEFNETFSFSRTICFYGYFLLGYYSGEETLEKIRRNKRIIVISGIILMIIIYAYCISGSAENVDLTGILTKDRSYKNIGMNIITGIITRAASIPISIVLGMLVVAVIPDKKNIFTHAGRNSIIILIFHKYFVLVFWKTTQILKMKTDTVMEIILSIITTVIITLFLSMDIFQRLYRKIMGKIERMVLKE